MGGSSAQMARTLYCDHKLRVEQIAAVMMVPIGTVQTLLVGVSEAQACPECGQDC